MDFHLLSVGHASRTRRALPGAPACARLGYERRSTDFEGYEDPHLEVIVTTKAKEPTVQVAEVVRHSRDEDELAELAAAVLRGVRAGYDARIRGWQCRSCPYAHACDR